MQIISRFSRISKSFSKSGTPPTVVSISLHRNLWPCGRVPPLVYCLQSRRFRAFSETRSFHFALRRTTPPNFHPIPSQNPFYTFDTFKTIFGSFDTQKSGQIPLRLAVSISILFETTEGYTGPLSASLGFSSSNLCLVYRAFFVRIIRQTLFPMSNRWDASAFPQFFPYRHQRETQQVLSVPFRVVVRVRVVHSQSNAPHLVRM